MLSVTMPLGSCDHSITAPRTSEQAGAAGLETREPCPLLCCAAVGEFRSKGIFVVGLSFVELVRVLYELVRFRT